MSMSKAEAVALMARVIAWNRSMEPGVGAHDRSYFDRRIEAMEMAREALIRESHAERIPADLPRPHGVNVIARLRGRFHGRA